MENEKHALQARVQALEQELVEVKEQAIKVCDFHRDMALRFSEDRDAKKHENRELLSRIAALEQERDDALIKLTMIEEKLDRVLASLPPAGEREET